MSDKYSIDDILAEIDKRRSSEADPEESTGKITESVTEIIGGSELDDLMRSAGAKTRMTESERLEQERAEEEEARQRAESIRLAAEANERKKAEQKQKKAEADEKRRREKQEKERLAQEKKQQKERLEQERRLEKERLEKEREEQRRIEAKRAAEGSSMQFTPEQEQPAEPEETAEHEHTGFTAELASPLEAAKLFAEPEEQAAETAPEVVQPQSEFVQPFVKPAVSGADDDIIFHTRSDLVTTETMKMRKLQRIEEINRALLAADRAAEDPDELVDSLNPMESRRKAVEELNQAAEPEQDIGDTLAVSGNDLKKMSSGEAEHVKEYSPVTSRKKNKNGAEDVLFTPGAQKKKESESEKERRGSDALIASLNQKLKEQREKNIAEERTVTLTDLSDPKNLPPRALNIDYDNKVIDTGILPKTDPVAAVQEAEALAARKKRRISSFMLQDIDDETDDNEDEDDDDYDEDEPEEVIDLDDENVVTERLDRAGKGLAGRLVILGLLTALTAALTVLFQFFRDGTPMFDAFGMSEVEEFLYAFLTIGILSFSACSSVVTNGFSRLIKGKPDGDTLCAFAHLGALGSLLMYLAGTNNLTSNKSFVYLFVSLLSLCFNTVTKLCTVRAAKNNFRFISGDTDKYYAECSGGEDAEQLARGAVRGFPVVASMHKTELLCDFIISTYCEDVSDRISRILTPIILELSVVGGALGFFTGNPDSIMNQWSQAATAFSAVLCIGASFTGALIVMLPMLSASRKTSERRAAILGYSAVEDFSAVNAVLVEAKSLFPAGSVSIRNIWDYNKNGKNGSQHVTIDEAIIYAASLAVSSDSILADPLFNMLNYKPALLKKVSNCVYESGMGVSGWIGSRRVLLGSRDHMKSHGIVVPDSKKESALNKKQDEVVYLAVAGEVCMLFFVTLSANPQVKNHVRRLAKNGVSLIIKTVDGVLSEGVVSELFDIFAENVKILPAKAHDKFEEHTKYAGKGSAAVSCDGTFSSLASAINGAKALHDRISWGCIMEIAGIALGVLLVFIFSVTGTYSLLSGLWIAGYNALWLILTIVVMAFKRI